MKQNQNILTGIPTQSEIPSPISRSRTKHIRPSKKDLQSHITTGSISSAAKYFCGTISAYKLVRQWCKEYKISIPLQQTRSEKSVKPPKHEFIAVLRKHATVRETAEHFNVSQTTINRWIREYKIRR